MRKVLRLPQEAQQEILAAIIEIEGRYHLTDLATDIGVTDLSERHDHYAKSRKPLPD